MKSNLDPLSRFAFSMATCLSSGIGPSKALQLSSTTAQSKPLQRAALAAAEACDHGLPISDGLALHEPLWPHFVIPILRAGEESGRLVEAFQLIHQHCVRLKPALAAVRNTWRYPLICILAGWAIRTGLLVYFGLYKFAWLLVRDTFLTGGLTVMAGRALLQTTHVKRAVDHLLLQLPLIRETLLRLDLVLFFTTFQLAYEAGGLSATAVLDLALATVGNSTIRKDLARVRPILEDYGSFADAFSAPALIPDSIKSSIAAGALSGRLGSALAQIVKTETVDLEIALDKFNRIFQRLLAYEVATSVVGTVLFCLSYK